jgi:YgiT-type zinc finger domain-containing protein
MKCVICHGDEMKVMEVKEEFLVDNNIICVPVKVPVCQSCGERYYDRRTVRFLEEVEKKLTEKGTKLKQTGKVLVYG